MEDPILPIPVSPPEPQKVSPGLCEKEAPRFFCLWLAEKVKRAFVTDGSSEAEVDYRKHRKWSRKAIEEFSKEYTERMPGMMDPSGSDSLDALMQNIYLNLRNEPRVRSWSYLFNTQEGKSYVCMKRYAENFCKQANAEENHVYGDREVIERVRGMRTNERYGSGSL